MKALWNPIAKKFVLTYSLGFTLLWGLSVSAEAAKIQIGALVSGQVEQVAVRVGQQVKPGQLLMQIDDRAYQAELAMQTAELKSLQLKLADAQIELDQATDLYDRTVTAKEFDAAKLAYELAEQAMLKAKAQLESTQAWENIIELKRPCARK